MLLERLFQYQLTNRIVNVSQSTTCVALCRKSTSTNCSASWPHVSLSRPRKDSTQRGTIFCWSRTVRGWNCDRST